VLAVALFFGAGIRHGFALMSFALCLFVTLTISMEFFKGANAIRSKTGQNVLAAMVELTHRNTRRYGGYIVHIAIVVMFIGFTGKAFDKDATVQVGAGETFHLGGYDMKVREISNGENENYVWSHAKVDIYQSGKMVHTLEPERRAYKASRQPTSEVDIWRRINEDVYLNFAGSEGPKAVIQAYVFPLVSWIWVGFWVLFAGTLICLVPNKVREVRSVESLPASRPAAVPEAELTR
ncbi:MAG: heme lyase CcmF/NrfE family subunit, partial [Bryobacteraceae bacterium]|nr:heme lyase CcmF/NrfE family subunit [Bryobacteraceae bacterium]